MNDEVKALIDWDSELEKMYADWGYTIIEPIL
jgi:hypothetical protein